MRYGKDQKQATRQRIVEAAGRRFKQDGIDGAGVAAVMSDAGLTNGAFYAHFTSKEDLVANVLADQLRAQRHSLDAQPSDRAGLEAFIRAYLSPQHRDQCADGCPSAALLDEIARRPAATRQVFTDELMGVIDDIAARLDPTDAEAARTDALTLFGMMIGTLQLARALTDRDLSDQLLARGVRDGLEAARRPGMTASQHAPPGNDDSGVRSCVSSDSAASGRPSGCARTAPSAKKQASPLRAWSSSNSGIWEQRPPTPPFTRADSARRACHRSSVSWLPGSSVQVRCR